MAEAKSIRELITEKSIALRYPDQLGPTKCAEELVALSSLLSSLNAHLSEKLYWLNSKKMAMLKDHGSAAKAKIYAEGSQEWRDFNDAKMQQEALIELIRALKYYLKNSETERREGQF